MSTPVSTSARLRANVVPLGLIVLAVVMIVVGGLWFRNAHDLRSTPSAQNQALVDSASTAKVEAEVSLALSRVLSYDYAKPAPTRASAEQYLRGEARKDYAELFSALQKRAPQEKLVLTAKVRTAGVRSLHGDKATLLVFLDQTSTRASDNKTSIAAAQVAIDAEDVDGSWHITGLKPL